MARGFATPKSYSALMSKDGGSYLTEAGLRFLEKQVQPVKLQQVAAWGRELRNFLPLHTDTESYYADAITGTLYRMDGASAGGAPMWLVV